MVSMQSNEIRRAAVKLRDLRIKASTAEHLLILALQNGLSRHGAPKDLCLRLGLSQAYLSDIRNGHRGIGDATVKKLCEVE